MELKTTWQPKTTNIVPAATTTAAEMSLGKMVNIVIDYTILAVIPIGIVFNTIIIFLMLKKKRKNDLSMYSLILIACIDQLVLVIDSFYYWINHYYGVKFEHISTNSCKLMVIIFTYTYLLAVWTVILALIERFVSLKFYLRPKYLFTNRKFFHSCLAISISLLIITSLNGILYHIYGNKNKCVIDDDYEYVYLQLWKWCLFGLYSPVPMVLLLVLSIVVMHTYKKTSPSMRTIQRELEKLSALLTSVRGSNVYEQNEVVVHDRAEISQNQTTMVIVSVSMKLFLVLLIITVAALVKSFEIPFVVFKINTTFEKLSLLALTINHSTNFLLYMVISEFIRNEFMNYYSHFNLYLKRVFRCGHE